MISITAKPYESLIALRMDKYQGHSVLMCSRIITLQSLRSDSPPLAELRGKINCFSTGIIPLQIAVTVLSEPVHEISNNVICATSKASDQPALTRNLIRAFANLLSIL